MRSSGEGANMNLGHNGYRSIGALLMVCMLPVAAAAQNSKFDALYVFGDSLADHGNIYRLTKTLSQDPTVPPSDSPHQTYFDGRFSNGYMAFEFLWQRLSRHAPGSPQGLQPFLASPFGETSRAVNFAYGGTGTENVDQTPGGFWAPGLKGQVELFRLSLGTRKRYRNALYAITTGANDYRIDPFNEPMDPNDVVANIADAVDTLYELGARNVMVLDLPDLGLLPGHSGDPASATWISALHNLLLDAALNDLQARRPELHLIRIKLAPLFQKAMSKLQPAVPALAGLGFAGAEMCLFIGPSLCPDVAPELFRADLGYVFWDVVHPTTEAHEMLGEYMYEQLADSYDE
jgi:phospholipase/lecithinase/hemolysin